jgi:aspartate aminotransferase
MVNNITLAARAAGITPSLTLAITAKAKKMKAEGVSIISFGAGEPDFNTPQYIIEAAKKALDKGLTKYTESSGIVALKKAIAEKFLKDNNLKYNINQIIVSNGAKHSLYNACSAIINEGDEVIIPSPYWLTYPELVKLNGGVPVYIATDKKQGFKVTAKQLEKAITPRTKAFILNSPSNPTGAVYSEEELKALAKVLEQSGIYIISDEIYEKLIYKGKHISVASLSQELYNKTIVVNGMSKSYSMTGWRIGYLAAPTEIAEAIDAIQSHETSNPNSIAQYASLEALTNPEGEKFLKEMVNTFNERRIYAVNKIKSIKGIDCYEPEGAFYVMVDIRKLKGKSYKGNALGGSVDVAEKLLDYGVAAVPGIAFGDDGYLRLSIAISLEDIKEGLDRLEKFVYSLK